MSLLLEVDVNPSSAKDAISFIVADILIKFSDTVQAVNISSLGHSIYGPRRVLRRLSQLKVADDVEKCNHAVIEPFPAHLACSLVNNA